MSKLFGSLVWHTDDVQEEEEQKQKINTIVGIPHIHHTNDSLAAIYYIYYLVSSFDPSTRCHGIKFSQWFPYLIENKLYHPLVCLSDTIYIDMHLQQQPQPTKGGKNNKKPILSFSFVEEQVEMHCNSNQTNSDSSHIVVIPLSPMSLIQSTEEDKHACMLIINQVTCTVEFFDSMGIINEQDVLLQSFIQDHWHVLMKLSKTKAKQYAFTSVMNEITCPLQSIGKNVSLPCQQDNYCLTYSTIYAHLRLLSPDVASHELMKTWSIFPKKQTNEMILKYIAWQEQVLISRSSFLF